MKSNSTLLNIGVSMKTEKKVEVIVKDHTGAILKVYKPNQTFGEVVDLYWSWAKLRTN